MARDLASSPSGSSPPPTIIVTDAETRAALATTRSLGRRAHVIAVGPRATSLAGSSRFAAERRTLPPALAAPESFAGRLVDLARETSADLVVPITDATLRALLPTREALRPTLLAAPDRAAYERLSDKHEVAERAREVGLRVPRGLTARNVDEAVAAAETLGWPVIVKPVLSVEAAPGGGLRKLGVARAASRDALHALWVEQQPERALVQEEVPGRGEGLFLLRWQGRTLAAFAHRRLREKPPEGGVSVLSESSAVDPEQRQRVERLVERFPLDGLVMAEFKRDSDAAWLMEFNVRPWGSMQLAVDAGVDFPALLVDAWLGRPAAEPPRYVLGRRLRWLLGDVDHALAVARGRSRPDGSRGIATALATLLRPAGPDCRWELLRREDPLPFFHALGCWIRGHAE